MHERYCFSFCCRKCVCFISWLQRKTDNWSYCCNKTIFSSYACDYEIRLPDHDFVNVTKHNLTPSLHAACEIRATSSKVIPEISYSGPKYIAICSDKHDSNTTYSHGRDIDHVLELEQFQSIANDCNEAKLIAMIFSDGGPDQNSRFPKTLEAPIQHFKKHKFDVLPVTTHDPQVCQPTIKWKVE